MRPKQWVKNAFVFAPLIFARGYLDPSAVTAASLAFVLFCLASSASYIVNDIHDIEQDRQHPKKKLSRPLASGRVSHANALILLGVLLFFLALGAFAMPQVLAVIAAYLALNLAYTFVLKHQPVVDIFSIAIGFVLRVYAGAVALSVPLSNWMAITTLSLALYLAAIKRRQELASNGANGRAVLHAYTATLIDRYAEISATGALIFYSLFVMSTYPNLAFTIPLVIFGLFRYWYIVEQLDQGESPTDVILTDWSLAVTVLAWIGVCVWMLWP
ncbi:MAG: decaprenyl-phosphate phosphoribosyltransferase [Rhodospirillaceae bacterium]|nr:decaprenyl-phosphate phosphoribosyltransferase [Rhodospirillaceae bacterium]